MKYTDTILKNADIKWRHPKIKMIEDGKVDFILTIPLTAILKVQAFRAFNYGIIAVMKFFEANQDKPNEELMQELEKQIIEWRKP